MKNDENQEAKALEPLPPPNILSLLPYQETILKGKELLFLSNLSSFDAPFLRQSVLAKGKFTKPGEYEVVFLELKKFIALAHLYGGPIAMLSPEVDYLWHEFILFTRKYIDFCNRFLGSYLHHEPLSSLNTLDRKAAEERFLDLYERTFGHTNSLWLNSSNCSNCMDPGGVAD
jgi:hypothetical protein